MPQMHFLTLMLEVTIIDLSKAIKSLLVQQGTMEERQAFLYMVEQELAVQAVQETKEKTMEWTWKTFRIWWRAKEGIQ